MRAYNPFTGPTPQRPNVAALSFLIENGANLRSDKQFLIVLPAATFLGIEEVVKAELEKEVDLNIPGGSHEIELAAAIWGRRCPGELGSPGQKFLNIIKLLLEHGPDANARSQMMHSPL